MNHGLDDTGRRHHCKSRIHLRSISDWSFMAEVQSAIRILIRNSWNGAQVLSDIMTSTLDEVSVSWSLYTHSLKPHHWLYRPSWWFYWACKVPVLRVLKFKLLTLWHGSVQITLGYDGGTRVIQRIRIWMI